MSVILKQIFVHAGKLNYHTVINRPLLMKLDKNFKNQSTLISHEFNELMNEQRTTDDLDIRDQKPISVLEEPDQLPDVSHVTPQLRPSFNFAYYADTSEVIKQLIDVGVDFHKIEQRKTLPSYLLQLDFEKDIKPYISFLFEQGVPPDQLGRFFTKNPFLFNNHMDDLKVRINYLESKQFTKEMISRIITVNPSWLNYPTKKVDVVLGNFQRELKLTADEIRYVVHKRPALLEVNLPKLRDGLFLFKDIIGFDAIQTKTLFLKAPYAWSLRRDLVQERIDAVLINMEVPLAAIVAQPSCLSCRAHKIKERHLFLKELGKAQYDPTKPGYVSIDDICIGNDATFCDRVAKTSIQTYNLFLKSL